MEGGHGTMMKVGRVTLGMVTRGRWALYNNEGGRGDPWDMGW